MDKWEAKQMRYLKSDNDTLRAKLAAAEEEITTLREDKAREDRIFNRAFFLLTNARPIMVGDKVAFYQVQPHAIDHLRAAIDGARQQTSLQNDVEE